MLAVKDIQVLVTCKDPGKVPGKIELYHSPGRPAAQFASQNRLALPGNKVLFADAAVDVISFGRAKPVDSVRDMHGRVLGLVTDGNPAGISRIAFLAEDATLALELREDGSLSECSWHCIGPYWDFPGYKNADGTRFRESMFKGQEWTKTEDTWGFTRYSWEETH